MNSKKRYYVELAREYICYNLDDASIKEIPAYLRRFW